MGTPPLGPFAPSPVPDLASPSTAAASSTATPPASGTGRRQWEWSWRTGVALGASILICLCIAPGGSGGAQLYYPLFNILLGFSIRDTAAIVSFVMFLGAIMSCGMAVAERHPTDPARRPLIDYGSVLVVSPALLLGVAFGVMLNAIVPLWVLQAASIGVFSWAFAKIMLPYLALRAKERERAVAAALATARARQAASVVVAAAPGRAATAPSLSSAALPAIAEARSQGSMGPAATAMGQDHNDDLARAAAAALVSDWLMRGVSGTSAAAAAAAGGAAPGAGSDADVAAGGIAAFCTVDAEVRALEAAALDDFPLSPRVSCVFARDPGTLLMIAAVDDAVAEVAWRRASNAAAPHMHSPSAAVAVVVGAAASKATSDDCNSAGVAGVIAAQMERLRAWASRQPALPIAGTLLVLVQQLTFSVLQRAVVRACTPGFYALLGARIAVTLLLAVGASVIVMRGRGHEQQQPEQQSEHGQQQHAGAPEELTQAASGGPAAGRAHVRARRRAVWVAQCEAARRRNWEAIQWRPRHIIEKNTAMLLIGVLGGCLGLGGGFAIAPLLLAMGLHPQCQAGTSKAILLISTLASSVSFLVAGRLPFTYALIFGLINVLVTPIGVVVTNAAIRRTGRPSLLVALNALSYSAGVVLLLAMSGIPAWIATAQGLVPAGLQVADLCSASS